VSEFPQETLRMYPVVYIRSDDNRTKKHISPKQKATRMSEYYVVSSHITVFHRHHMMGSVQLAPNDGFRGVQKKSAQNFR
jgi:hypothetical protein